MGGGKASSSIEIDPQSMITYQQALQINDKEIVSNIVSRFLYLFVKTQAPNQQQATLDKFRQKPKLLETV